MKLENIGVQELDIMTNDELKTINGGGDPDACSGCGAGVWLRNALSTVNSVYIACGIIINREVMNYFH